MCKAPTTDKDNDRQLVQILGLNVPFCCKFCFENKLRFETLTYSSLTRPNKVPQKSAEISAVANAMPQFRPEQNSDYHRVTRLSSIKAKASIVDRLERGGKSQRRIEQLEMFSKTYLPTQMAGIELHSIISPASYLLWQTGSDCDQHKTNTVGRGHE